MDPIKLQQDLRNNEEDRQNYIRDLRNWTEQIKKKDSALSSQSKRQTTPAPTADEKCKGGGDSKKTEIFKNSSTTETEDSRRKKIAKKGEPSDEVIKLKEAGNECLKNKLYQDAIKHYSAAMELDPDYHILPANRGMAYLKLNLFEEAEEDCGKAVLLDPLYIKGYLRRGSARLELGKLQLARDDFQQVLKLESHNPQAKMSLERIRLEEEKHMRLQAKCDQSSAMKTSTAASKSEPSQTATKPPHLRSKKPLKKITITEVRNDDELATFIDHGRVSPVEDTPSVASGASENGSAVCAKGEAAGKPDRLEPAEVPSSSPPCSPGSPPPVALPATPRSSYEFIRDWKLLRAHPEQRRRYLLQIPPDRYPAIFKQALEESTLVEILHVIERLPAAEIGSHLRGLCQVQRLDVLVMFMGAADQRLLRNLVSRCAEDGQDVSDIRRRVGL